MKARNLFLIAVTFAFAACNNNTSESNDNTVTDTTSATEVSSSSSVASAPMMSFTTDSYDFGKIKDGEKVVYDFEFKNTGNTPLIIKDATATCGCTVPDFPKEPIAPGASGKINVVFDSAGKTGLQDKVITITANTIPAQNTLHLIGEVTQ